MTDGKTVSADASAAAVFAARIHTIDERVQTLVLALHHLDVEHRRIRTRFAQSLGRSASEFNAIAFLSEFGHRTPKELAQNLGMTTGSATAMIDRLEEAGLLNRGPHPHDRRRLLLHLTPAAVQAMDRVYARYVETITDAARSAPDPSCSHSAEFLEKIADALRSDSASEDSVRQKSSASPALRSADTRDGTAQPVIVAVSAASSRKTSSGLQCVVR